MKKKLFGTTIVAISSVILAGCSGAIDTGTNSSSNSSATAAASSVPESCKQDGALLAVLLPNQTNPYYVAMKKGFETEGAAKGFKVEVQIANDDDANQLAQAQALLGKNPCALALNPVKSEPAAAIVKAANDKGVPVFTVNIKVDPAALKAQGGSVVQYLGADNAAGGKQMADQMLEDFGKDASLKIGFVTEPDEVTTVARDNGFADGISANTNAAVVAKVDGNVKLTDSLNVTSDLLQGHPELNAIFASTGPGTQGAIEAVKAAGRDVKVYGFCASELPTDTVHYPACVAQEPEDYGKRVVEQIKMYVDGEKVEPEILRPLKEFTKGQTPAPGEVG